MLQHVNVYCDIVISEFNSKVSATTLYIQNVDSDCKIDRQSRLPFATVHTRYVCSNCRPVGLFISSFIYLWLRIKFL